MKWGRSLLRDRYPKDLRAHRLLPLVEMAAQRPVDLNAIKQKIKGEYWSEGVAEELQIVIEALNSEQRWRRDAANLFVASVRALCELDREHGLEFGRRLVRTVPDPRAVRSIVTYQARAGHPQRALGYLELLDDDEWTLRTRAKLERSLRSEAGTPERSFLRYTGSRALASDTRQAVLLYGDLNMNLIDGSSVWLASVAEALSGLGFEVHFVLKYNIERRLLLEPLMSRPDIELFEPRAFGFDHLSQRQAAEVIEYLDGVYGGYRCVFLRGLSACEKVAGRKSLWRRVWAYLTDFYQQDDEAPEGIRVDEETREAFADFKHIFEYFLVQTDKIANYLENDLGVASSQVIKLPPMIPDGLEAVSEAPAPPTSERPFRIGYAGKIAPLWGVLELISAAERLRGRGYVLEVHIFGDKIHASNERYPTFEEDARAALESEVVCWHRSLSRAETLEAMCGMDLGWCYRDPKLERSTMELSTKIVENMAVGLPFVATRNEINSALLGGDYPLFVDDAAELDDLLVSCMEEPERLRTGSERYRELARGHTITATRETVIRPVLPQRQGVSAPKKVVLAGHDLKFIGEFESHLKRLGHEVKRDVWEWGRAADETRSHHLSRWADYVFCEWGLANAVWYSKNLDSDKRLVLRIHLQEVAKRGRVFPPDIEMENVDAVAFVADHVRERAMEDFGWDGDGLVTVPNYLNVDIFARPKLDDARFNVAIVGIIPAQHKRLDRALDLIRELRREDERFRLVIKGSLPKDLPWMAGKADEMTYYAEQFGRIDGDPLLRGGVRFDGFTPRLAGWYQGIGCVLSPSGFESFHYSVAEGAASGALPVVWPWEGAAQIYPEEWIVRDVGEAKDRILENLGEHFEGYATRAEENRKYLREHFGMERVLDQLTSLLLEGAV